MSQGYSEIPVTEKVYESLPKLLERDTTGVTGSAGTSFPQEIEEWMIGRTCLRTDLKSWYYLSSVSPISWTLMIDFSQPLATLNHVQSNYQPLNSNLTALSNLVVSADTIPYFNTSTTMSIITFNTFLKNLVNAGSASATRSLLGLGSLATKSKVSASDIDNGSLPVSKFNFTPITAGEGYTVGDVKESYNSSAESGYLELNKNYTIGNTNSGATYKGSAYNNLYVKLWGNSAVNYYTSSGSSTNKGSSASADWTANVRISLPKGTNYINPNCYYRIKY